MKRKISYTIALLFSSTIMVLMASCAIYSKKPLADINEVHESLLIGTWQSSTDQNNGDIYTIKDEGKYYIVEHNKNKTRHKLTLTKLNNKYFISDIYEKFCFIWMLHVDKEKLILYTLPVSAREKIFGKRDIIQISNAKLRKLCADHIDDFSVEVQKFIRIDSQFRAKKDSAQKIYYDFLKEFFACESNLPQLGNTQSEAIEFGNKLQYASEQMYTVISRYNLPETIQNAAIEYAKSVSDAGRTFRAVPYIPTNEADAFLHGFFRGLGGDITGGAMEIDQWKNEVKRKLETVRSRAENMKIIMIKHGVKY